MTLEPNLGQGFNQLSLEASFSSSSSSDSSLDILDMSDIIALCDKDVKLTAMQIKQIFKGLVNKISQIQLSHLIRSDNLKKGMNHEVTNQKKQSQCKNDQEERKIEKSNSFEMTIQQRKQNDIQNLPKPIKQKSKSKRKSETQKKQKLFKVQQKLSLNKKVKQNPEYSRKQLQQKIKKLQEQLQNIKKILKSHIQIQKQLRNAQYQFSQNNQKQKDSFMLFKSLKPQNQNNTQNKNNFNIVYSQTRIDIEYIGNDQAQNILKLKQINLNNVDLVTVKILKTLQNKIKIGVVGQKIDKYDQKATSQQSVYINAIYNDILKKMPQNEISDQLKKIVSLRFKRQNNKISKIQWLINQELLKQQNIKQQVYDETLKFVPCLIFKNKNDRVQIKW